MEFASDGGELASRHDDGDGDDGDAGDQKSNFWWGLLLMEGISQADMMMVMVMMVIKNQTFGGVCF